VGVRGATGEEDTNPLAWRWRSIGRGEGDPLTGGHPGAPIGRQDPATVESILADAEARAATGVSLERIADDAVSVEAVSHGFRVVFAGGRSVAADRVVLTPGYSPPKDLPVENAAFYQSQRYLGDA